MCAICMKSPCDSRCPNAPEPPAVYTCKSCGEPIEVGEEYFELGGDHYHEDCFREDAVQILLDDYGATSGVAELEELSW